MGAVFLAERLRHEGASVAVEEHELLMLDQETDKLNKMIVTCLARHSSALTQINCLHARVEEVSVKQMPFRKSEGGNGN